MLSHFSCVRLFVNLWTVAHQAPLSMGFSRQEYWSGLPGPPPGDPLDPGIEPTFPVTPALQADAFNTEPRKPLFMIYKHLKLLLQEDRPQYLVYYTVRKGILIAIFLLHLFCFSWNSYYSQITLILSISLYFLSQFWDISFALSSGSLILFSAILYG